jgi:hypothetical protein
MLATLRSIIAMPKSIDPRIRSLAQEVIKRGANKRAIAVLKRDFDHMEA